MGQLCARMVRSDEGADGALGLTPVMRQAIKANWASVASEQAHYSFNFYKWLLQMTAEVPPDLEQYLGVESEGLKDNTEFNRLALEFFEELDLLLKSLDQPKAQHKKVVDRICQSYMYRGQSEKYFQYVMFLLVRYLKEAVGVEPMAELAWIQLVNKMSVNMWEYSQSYQHRREYKRSLSVLL